MEPKTLEWVISQGIGAVLALVMFLVYRKDVKNGMSAWKAQTEILIGLTSASTRTHQKVADALRELKGQPLTACPLRAGRLVSQVERAEESERSSVYLDSQ